MTTGFLKICLFSLLLASPTAVSAQIAGQRPRVGLALSGGGAKGFAHIGVLRVLDELGIPIDCIAGSSMGAIIGGLYAIGYPTEALEKLVTSLDWTELFSDSRERRYLNMIEKPWDSRYIASFEIRKKSVQLPVGLVAGQKIASLLSRLTWPVHHVQDFTTLPIPFACVAADIETGDAVRLTGGFLPEALRASMAIPTIFTPIKINGRLLVDGGLVRNLPVEDARALGADIVIAVDVGAPLKTAAELNSIFAILDQAVSLYEAKLSGNQQDSSDLLIKPQFGELGFSDFDRAEAFIRLGEAAAREKISELLTLKHKLEGFGGKPPAGRSAPARIDSILIKAVKFDGLEKVSSRLVTSELGITENQWVTPAQLEQAVSRLYSSLFFERVTYKLEPWHSGTKLTFKFIERASDFFNFGLRYDSHNETVFLFNTTFRNLTGQGSALKLDLLLSGLTAFDTEYYLHTGWQRGLGLRAHLNIRESAWDVFEGKQRTARLKLRAVVGDLLIGKLYTLSYSLGAGLRGEIARTLPDITQEPYPEETFYISSVLGVLRVDTFDRTVYPRRGHALRFTGELALRALGGNVDYRLAHLDWQGFFPLTPRLALFSRLQLGSIVSENVPRHKQFFLGGVDSFVGLRPQELAGNALQAVQIGLRWEVLKNRYFTFKYNTGTVLDDWRLKIHEDVYHSGVSLGVGMLTRFGPIDWTIAFGNRRKSISHLNLGFHF